MVDMEGKVIVVHTGGEEYGRGHGDAGFRGDACTAVLDTALVPLQGTTFPSFPLYPNLIR